MKRITIAGFVLIALISGPLFASGEGEQSKGAASGEQAELDFWSWRTEDVEVYNELISRFQEDNPGISVNYTAHKNTEYNTVLSAAVKGENAPDIIHLRAYGGLEQYAQPGYLEPLGNRIPELSDFTDQAIRAATSRADGKIYGVPYASQTLVIYYNKRMYDELGLTEPTTWDQFISNLEAMKEEGITPLANGGKDGWTLEVMHGVISPNYYGANEFFNEVVEGETTFTDSRYKRSLEQLLELRPYMPDSFMGVGYTDMQRMFVNEMAGHFIGGSWEAAFFESQNPDFTYGETYGVFAGPVPKRGDTRYVSSFADGSYGMSSDSSNKDAATSFLRYLASPEAGQYITDQLGVLSYVPGVEPSDPFLKDILELNQNSTPYIHLVGFRYEQPTGSSLLQSALQGMMAGDLDSAGVAEELQEGLATWYEPFQ